MLIQQVDRIDLEPPERRLGHIPNVLRAAVESALTVGFEREAELRGDDDLAVERRERFADQFLVDERAIRLGGVEERDAAFHGGTDQRNPGLLVDGRSIAEAQAHAPESERGNLQATAAKPACLHE